VGTALTGAQGVDVTKRVKPDVLVIDFHLPDMDAPEAIRQLREHIAMSRSSQSQDPNGRERSTLHQGRQFGLGSQDTCHSRTARRDSPRRAGWPFANEEMEATRSRTS